MQLSPWPKQESAFAIKFELSSLTINVLLLRQSASKRISCFHDSLKRAKRMKASSELALVTALVRPFLSVSMRRFGLRVLRCASWKRPERVTTVY